MMYNFAGLRAASRTLSELTAQERSAALLSFADLLESESETLLEASAKDYAEHKATLSPANAARLLLSPQKIATIIAQVRSVAALQDPIGVIQTRTELDKGLVLERVSAPIGVFAIIFESRADVAPQILSLALRSGNAVVLKGGKETQRVNNFYASIMKKTTDHITTIGNDWFQMHHDRATVDALLGAVNDIDLIIPRGSNELVQSIKERSLVPVLSHADGVCHIYVHESAHLQDALALILDSKTQYPAACNAVETVLIDRSIAPQFLPLLIQRAEEHNIELRGCEELLRLAPKAQEVTGSDWHTEYGDTILAIKVVAAYEQALAHINTFGSHHTDAIIAKDPVIIEKFLKQVDSASVFANCSTRFADGFRYGLGAEIGISTGRIHARGPVGIEGLMTYKYMLRGDTNIVATYAGEEGKPFLHNKLSVID
jgi:glutamate-5-semialdehyde dehydrogenase